MPRDDIGYPEVFKRRLDRKVDEGSGVFTRLIDKAMRAGIGGYDRETKRRLSMVNLAGYLAAFSSTTYAINFALYNFSVLKWMVLVNLLSAVLTASAPFWHRYNSIAAALVETTTVAVTLFYFVSVLGRDSGVQLNYIGAVAIAFVIFGLEYLWIIAVVTVICIAGHLSTYFLFATGSAQWAIDDGFMRQLYILSATSIILILALIVWYAFRLAADAEARNVYLLQNIFPEKIAERLRRNPEQPIADRFDEASVLFADIVGFTDLSNRLPPDELVSLLNDIFSGFDEVGTRLGTEKIKTIGDAYMAVSGAPEPVDDHAERLLRLAIEILQVIRRVGDRHNHQLDLRIGIASGPVTAGVIGKAKFAYDVWAPTVNLAARLQSSGAAGRIHVSHEIYRALSNKFPFEPAPTQRLKGLGRVGSWYYAG